MIRPSTPGVDNPPAVPLSPSAWSVSPQASSAPVTQPLGSPACRWFLTLPGGQCTGPVTQDVLLGWVQQGQVPGNALVLPEGSQEWLPVMQVFPQLAHPIGHTVTANCVPAVRVRTLPQDDGRPLISVESRTTRRTAQRRRNEWLGTVIVAVLFIVAVLLIPIVIQVVLNAK